MKNASLNFNLIKNLNKNDHNVHDIIDNDMIDCKNKEHKKIKSLCYNLNNDYHGEIIKGNEYINHNTINQNIESQNYYEYYPKVKFIDNQQKSKNINKDIQRLIPKFSSNNNDLNEINKKIKKISKQSDIYSNLKNQYNTYQEHDQLENISIIDYDKVDTFKTDGNEKFDEILKYKNSNIRDYPVIKEISEREKIDYKSRNSIDYNKNTADNNNSKEKTYNTKYLLTIDNYETNKIRQTYKNQSKISNVTRHMLDKNYKKSSNENNDQISQDIYHQTINSGNFDYPNSKKTIENERPSDYNYINYLKSLGKVVMNKKKSNNYNQPVQINNMKNINIKSERNITKFNLSNVDQHHSNLVNDKNKDFQTNFKIDSYNIDNIKDIKKNDNNIPSKEQKNINFYSYNFNSNSNNHDHLLRDNLLTGNTSRKDVIVKTQNYETLKQNSISKNENIKIKEDRKRKIFSIKQNKPDNQSLDFRINIDNEMKIYENNQFDNKTLYKMDKDNNYLSQENSKKLNAIKRYSMLKNICRLNEKDTFSNLNPKNSNYNNIKKTYEIFLNFDKIFTRGQRNEKGGVVDLAERKIQNNKTKSKSIKKSKKTESNINSDELLAVKKPNKSMNFNLTDKFSQIKSNAKYFNVKIQGSIDDEILSNPYSINKKMKKFVLKIVRIQRWWRRVINQHFFITEKVIKIQSVWRGYLRRCLNKYIIESLEITSNFTKIAQKIYLKTPFLLIKQFCNKILTNQDKIKNEIFNNELIPNINDSNNELNDSKYVRKKVKNNISYSKNNINKSIISNLSNITSSTIKDNEYNNFEILNSIKNNNDVNKNLINKNNKFLNKKEGNNNLTEFKSIESEVGIYSENDYIDNKNTIEKFIIPLQNDFFSNLFYNKRQKLYENMILNIKLCGFEKIFSKLNQTVNKIIFNYAKFKYSFIKKRFFELLRNIAYQTMSNQCKSKITNMICTAGLLALKDNFFKEINNLKFFYLGIKYIDSLHNKKSLKLNDKFKQFETEYSMFKNKVEENNFLKTSLSYNGRNMPNNITTLSGNEIYHNSISKMNFYSSRCKSFDKSNKSTILFRSNNFNYQNENPNNTNIVGINSQEDFFSKYFNNMIIDKHNKTNYILRENITKILDSKPLTTDNLSEYANNNDSSILNDNYDAFKNNPHTLPNYIKQHKNETLNQQTIIKESSGENTPTPRVEESDFSMIKSNFKYIHHGIEKELIKKRILQTIIYKKAKINKQIAFSLFSNVTLSNNHSFYLKEYGKMIELLYKKLSFIVSSYDSDKKLLTKNLKNRINMVLFPINYPCNMRKINKETLNLYLIEIFKNIRNMKGKITNKILMRKNKIKHLMLNIHNSKNIGNYENLKLVYTKIIDYLRFTDNHYKKIQNKLSKSSEISQVLIIPNLVNSLLSKVLSTLLFNNILAFLIPKDCENNKSNNSNFKNSKKISKFIKTNNTLFGNTFQKTKISCFNILKNSYKILQIKQNKQQIILSYLINKYNNDTNLKNQFLKRMYINQACLISSIRTLIDLISNINRIKKLDVFSKLKELKKLKEDQEKYKINLFIQNLSNVLKKSILKQIIPKKNLFKILSNKILIRQFLQFSSSEKIKRQKTINLVSLIETVNSNIFDLRKIQIYKILRIWRFYVYLKKSSIKKVEQIFQNNDNLILQAYQNISEIIKSNNEYNLEINEDSISICEGNFNEKYNVNDKSVDKVMTKRIKRRKLS